MLYLKDGTKLPNQKWYSATDEQVQAAIDTRISDGTLKMPNGSNGNHDALDRAYAYPLYTTGAIADDGTVTESTISCYTELLPVAPGETIVLSSNLTKKVAYYAEDKTFVSILSLTTGLNEYVVPNNAYYARFENSYPNGDVAPFSIRRKEEPKNNGFYDLIMSPIKTRPQIGITGDSNTYGYGLSDTSKSWANLFGSVLQEITELHYYANGPWTEVIGAKAYSSVYNFMAHSEFSIWTDAENLTLSPANNYSSAWDWYVDGELQSGKTSETSIVLDGNFHKVTVRFTAGQATGTKFVITKQITVENVATSGSGFDNVTIPTDKDWLLVMIGTNDTDKTSFRFRRAWFEYAYKGTYIVPFPKHNEESFPYPMAKVYGAFAKTFEAMNYEIVNISDVAGAVFYDDSLFAGSDLIHYSENGHRVIANIVSGKLGLPTYFKAVT